MKTTYLFTATIVILFTCGQVLAQDTTLTITNTGNVGIGTTNPMQKFVVQSSTGYCTAQLQPSNGSRGQMTIYDDGQLLLNSYNSSLTPGYITFCPGDVVDTRSVVITSSGNVGIGNASPTSKLVVRPSSSQRLIDFHDVTDTRMGWITLAGSGDDLQLSSEGTLIISSETGVEVTNEASDSYRPITASAFNVGSSASFKTEIRHLTENDCDLMLDNISNLKPATYELVNPSVNGRKARHLGLIAEEVSPELRGPNSDAVDLYALTTSLTAAIKALKAQVDQQAKAIQELQRQLGTHPEEKRQ